MTLSNGQLLTPVTEAEAFDVALQILAELGFPVTAWQPGRVQHTRVRLIARLYSELTGVIAALTLGGTRDAVGAYADLRGQYLYDTERDPADPTQGYVHLVSDLTAPALSYEAGEVRFQISSAVFENVDPIELDPGETADFLVQAVTPGSASNVATDAACSFLSPAVVGVTPTNPAYADGTWITELGQDAEEDERYLTRAEGVIERQEYGSAEGQYRLWTLEALPEIPLNRVNVVQGPGEGEIEVIAGTLDGGLTGEQIDTITDYLNGTDGIGRRPINDDVTVISASVLTTPAISVTAYVFQASVAGAQATIESAIDSYLESLALGGTAYQAALVAAIMAVPGVTNVTGVPNDVTLDSDEIYVPTISVTVVPV